MNILNANNIAPDQASGNTINLWRTNPRHVAGFGEQQSGGGSTGFGQMLFDGLNQVNDLQQEHSKLAVQAITDPTSINAHDLTIAQAKASLALNITKNVVDRVIRAYQDIINVR